MKLKLVVLLGFALGMGRSVLVAQEDPATKTFGAYNGRAWQGWGDSIRLGYIIGYTEGAIFVISVKNIDTSAKENSFLRHTLWPEGMKNGEIVKALDRLYVDPLNLRIPIEWALGIVASEASGDSKDTVDAYIRSARSRAAGK